MPEDEMTDGAEASTVPEVRARSVLPWPPIDNFGKRSRYKHEASHTSYPDPHTGWPAARSLE